MIAGPGRGLLIAANVVLLLLLFLITFLKSLSLFQYATDRTVITLRMDICDHITHQFNISDFQVNSCIN